MTAVRDTLPEREETTEPAQPGEAAGPSPRSRWPLVAVGAVVLFNLIVLRAEARPVDNLNDASIHRSMIAWANDRIEEGHLPLDGWYPDLSLGSSRFHHYQSLPHVLGGYLAVATGPDLALSWTLYLGMALWPIAVYAGGRLLGWGPWVSAIAAVCSPLVASQATLGYEWGSYTWRGYGTWAQLWGMWLLPFAWGLSWRSVSRGRSYWLTALVLALAIACHLLTGYLALLSLGVFVVVKWRGILRRIGRAALVGIASLLVGAWVVVPLVADRVWTVNDEFSRGKVFYDSFGAKQIMTWFASGELFDRGRLPMVTILVAAGIVTAAWRFRRDERARALLGLFVLSLVLFFGRTTWGSLLRLLPGSGDLFLRRFISGVHLAGLYLAGVGAVRLGQIALGWLRRIRQVRASPAVAGFIAACAAFAFLAPAIGERATWANTGGRWIGEQAVADAADGADVSELIAMARERGPGRFYGGLRSNWGSQYVVGQVPMYAVLLNHSLEHVGFTRPTWSLSSPVEYRFNDRNPAHYDLFAVRYLILEEDRSPPANAERIAQRGRHVLWEVPSADYVDLVDVLPPNEAERTNLGLSVADWLGSEQVGLGLHPGIEFEGHPAPEPTLGAGERPEEPPGTVVDQEVDLRDGFARATVVADRPSFVMLKTSFDPRWQVTLDGDPVDPEMIAPSFVGRSVPPGEHVLTFVYEPFPRYDVLLLVGALTLFGLWFVPGWLRRRRGARPAANAPGQHGEVPAPSDAPA
jgi:Family of unknown function (DUF6541)